MATVGTDAQENSTDTTVGVQELGHVVLYVRNIDRSVDFYRNVLGWHQLTPPEGSRHMPVAIFSGGRTHHELLLIEVGENAAPVPSGQRVGLYHFGLKVGDNDDDLRVMVERLQKAGTQIVGATDHGFTHSLYILDPDGNEIELYIDVPGTDWSDFSTIAQPPKPLHL